MTEKEKARELIERIENELYTFVDEKRLSHILSVRKTVLFLCDIFCSLGENIDREKAEQAALLHDITKCMNQKELCERYGIELSDDDEKSPETLHAITGAYFARDKYGICDEVFSAIKKHTVGDLEMSLLDKIIFVSDYCEETRTHAECKASREQILKIPKKLSEIPAEQRKQAAIQLLDLVMAEIMFKTIKFLSCGKGHIHAKTYDTLRVLLALNKGNKEFCALCGKYSDVMNKIPF